jgi:hypothetical protein
VEVKGKEWKTKGKDGGILRNDVKEEGGQEGRKEGGILRNDIKEEGG